MSIASIMRSSFMDISQPLFSNDVVSVILPHPKAGLSSSDIHLLQNIPVLLSQNRAALELELGAPFQIVDHDPGEGARWVIGPTLSGQHAGLIHSSDHPYLFIDREKKLLITDAPDINGLWESFSWLRSTSHFSNGLYEVTDCSTTEEAVSRIIREVGISFPSFEQRDLDWASICDRYAARVLESSEPITWMQKWLAELHDGHTWVRPSKTLIDRPYDLRLTNEHAIFTRIPIDTPAWNASVRAGFRLVVSDAKEWLGRTAASPHSRALVAGRRLLAGEAGSAKNYVAVSPSGMYIEWEDPVPADPWSPIIEYKVLPSGTGYCRIRAWLRNYELEEKIEEAFDRFKHLDRLIVDLRSNPGGDLPMALRFRDRFLPKSDIMGWIRSRRIDDEGLTEPSPILGEPANERDRWLKPVRFLTNPLTYSSSEDVLFGLQGLPHVQVVGEPSGGGSGRMRNLRLLPGWRLTVSTALTYDRHHRCIEGVGIPVDLPFNDHLVDDTDTLLQHADTNW